MNQLSPPLEAPEGGGEFEERAGAGSWFDEDLSMLIFYKKEDSESTQFE